MDQSQRISAEEFILLLVDACPTFRYRYDAELIEAQANGHDPIWISVIDDFGRHLGSLLRSDEIDSFPAVFAVVERGLLDGDGWVRDALADELLDDLASGMGTYCDPEDFQPFLGPVAAERWATIQRSYRSPDPGYEFLLKSLVWHNPARLEGDLSREYRRVAEYLPSLLDMTDSYSQMRRALWVRAKDYIAADVVGPEERFNALAEELWAKRAR